MNENLLYNMYRFAACKDLFKRIRGIPYAMVKGEALSMAAYGRPGKRSYSDIDLLVPKDYLEKMEEELWKTYSRLDTFAKNLHNITKLI